MVEFTIKVHLAQRQAYIPKEIVEALGTRLKAKPDRYAMVIYPEGMNPELVIKSLEILLDDLRLERSALPKKECLKPC
ncbi:MAG: hypothetical protein QMD10_11195 [Desulfitobacteriaceae bacterium]|nr:hypothetical protein [Desulfitobacteriaceae bacterium]